MISIGYIDGWRKEGRNILNMWGCNRGFVVAMCPAGGPESDAPPGSKRWKQVQAFQKCKVYPYHLHA